MPFNWSDFLVLAKEISLQTGQAHMRCAISRAYYAAYWNAREFLEDFEGPIPTSGSHQYVWDKYDNIASSLGGTIGDVGKLLKAQRHHADYNGQRSVRILDVAAALKRAEAIINDIANLTT